MSVVAVLCLTFCFHLPFAATVLVLILRFLSLVAMLCRTLTLRSLIAATVLALVAWFLNVEAQLFLMFIIRILLVEIDLMMRRTTFAPVSILFMDCGIKEAYGATLRFHAWVLVDEHAMVEHTDWDEVASWCEGGAVRYVKSADSFYFSSTSPHSQKSRPTLRSPALSPAMMSPVTTCPGNCLPNLRPNIPCLVGSSSSMLWRPNVKSCREEWTYFLARRNLQALVMTFRPKKRPGGYQC